MSKSEALNQLSQWFERQKRVLPWREEATPYRVWVSEIMLQQTQVAAVVPFFERFVKRFPDVGSLAAASSEDVMAHWAGLGYYSRARNLHAAAKEVAAAGRFPATRDGWLSLPGIGPYTAGAILSISADLPVPILDGNVERVLSRVRRVARGRGDAVYKARLWRLAKIFVERAHAQGIRPSVLNQALMELGATVCTPRSAPACSVCPLSSICRARAEGDPLAYPPAKRPKQWIQVEEELHCWLNADHKILLRKRSAGEWRAGLWDLMDHAPGAGAKLVAEVETRHVVTHHKIRRVTKIWRMPARLQVAEECDGSRWVPLRDPGVPVGSALVRSLAKVEAALADFSKFRPVSQTH